MSKFTVTLCSLVVLTATAAFAQTKPAFEVATVKPSPPMDMLKVAAALQAGGKMPIGANVDNARAEYTYLDLRSLITYAYGMKPYQIAGPDWMATTRFDIVAKMPEGSKKEDAPKMLQTLLEERFKLTTHRASAEHPVLALVAGEPLIVAGRPVKAVDTTGAGDCFVGAVAAQLAGGSSITDALDYADAAASICVQRMGAAPSMPTAAEVAAAL